MDQSVSVAREQWTSTHNHYSNKNALPKANAEKESPKTHQILSWLKYFSKEEKEEEDCSNIRIQEVERPQSRQKIGIAEAGSKPDSSEWKPELLHQNAKQIHCQGEK